MEYSNLVECSRKITTHLVSPAMAAAGIAGHIVDIRE